MNKQKQQFIKELHSDSRPDLKTRIERLFPKLFKKLEVGKWYKEPNYGSAIYCITSIESNRNFSAYGFNWENRWTDKKLDFGTTEDSSLTPATNKEVEEALIKEAKKRGFKEGVNFNVCRGSRNVQEFKSGHYFRMRNDGALCIRAAGCGTVFYKGKWATIIKETITKEQAEKKLGVSITCD